MHLLIPLIAGRKPRERNVCRNRRLLRNCSSSCSFSSGQRAKSAFLVIAIHEESQNPEPDMLSPLISSSMSSASTFLQAPSRSLQEAHRFAICTRSLALIDPESRFRHGQQRPSPQRRNPCTSQAGNDFTSRPSSHVLEKDRKTIAHGLCLTRLHRHHCVNSNKQLQE
jgi:hypothetical protein